jgi:pimeloyl-ACP methyl ester carboxylesterase
VAADAALAGRRCILVDLLGSGFSDKPLDFGYTVADHAGVLLDFLDGLALDSVDVFGHSMGGAIAIELATRLGQRLRRLVLSEPNLDAGGGFVSKLIAAQSEADYVAQGHADMVRASRQQGAHVWAGSLAVMLPQATYRQSMSLVEGGSPSWRDQLATLAVPRTVIYGAQSLPDPNTDSLPALGVTIAIVADAGHSMAWENPSGLAQAIAAALRG